MDHAHVGGDARPEAHAKMLASEIVADSDVSIVPFCGSCCGDGGSLSETDEEGMPLEEATVRA